MIDYRQGLAQYVHFLYARYHLSEPQSCKSIGTLSVSRNFTFKQSMTKFSPLIFFVQLVFFMPYSFFGN